MVESFRCAGPRNSPASIRESTATSPGTFAELLKNAATTRRLIVPWWGNPRRMSGR